MPVAPSPRFWVITLILLDQGTMGVVGHRQYSSEEIRDVIEGGEPPSGVTLQSYSAISSDGTIINGPRKS
jgi:hypothetical protein